MGVLVRSRDAVHILIRRAGAVVLKMISSGIVYASMRKGHIGGVGGRLGRTEAWW